MPICLRLLTHCARRAASRAAWTAGRSRAISTAMIAITTSSSIRVNPRRRIGDPPQEGHAGSVGVGGKDLTSLASREGLKDRQGAFFLDEPDAPVGEGEVRPAGVSGPELVGVCGLGVRAVELARVREDQGAAPFGA